MLLPAMYKYSGLDDYYKRLEYYLFVYKSFGTSTHERPISQVYQSFMIT